MGGMSIIPAGGRLRKDNSEFEAGLSYLIRPLPQNEANSLPQIHTQDIILLGGYCQLAHIKENRTFFGLLREGFSVWP